MTAKLLAAILSLMLPACTSGFSPIAGGSKEASKDEQQPTEDERPTDAAEGVPGYFAAPSKITVQTENQQTTITATAGTAASTSGTGRVRIAVYGAAFDDVLAAARSNSATTVAAKRLMSILAESDGSFTTTTQSAASELVLLSAAVSTDANKLTLPAADSSSRPSLIFTDLASPVAFAPVQAGRGSASLSVRCALGPALDGRKKLVTTPGAFADGQYCTCGKETLADDHPLRKFFSGPAVACTQAPVPTDRAAKLAATFVEFQPGVCSPVYFDCAMDAEVKSETLNPGTRHRRANFIDAWKLAMTVCHTFTSNALTDPFKISDISESECDSVRQRIEVGGKSHQACDLDMGDNHPAVIARCLGNSLTTRKPCDYLSFYSSICTASPSLFNQ